MQGGGGFGVNVGGNYGKGKANGEEVAYRNSHVGSTTGKTTISAGETLNIKGGQVAGIGVDITAKDMNIESLQDTMTYNSKQQQGSVDVTIGYGFSGSASYSQSKINADYASVNEQSGIFAGDDGYQINVKNHTDLKGGIITSTQNAENNGKNRFETGTLSFNDLANHAEYKGEAIGIGVSGSVKGENSKNPNSVVADKTGMSNTMGYGRESDKQYATTHSGINTANITIRDEEKQQEITGRTAEETKRAVKTDLTLENYAEHSGSLKNNLDKEKLQNEIDLQVEVTKEAAPLIAQGVALASEYLGKVREYEEKLLHKDLLEQAISQSNDPEEIVRLNQALNEVDSYLTENKARYDLFKEGGLGRAGLHAVGGGILTGDISGAAGAGVTSLSAPIIAQVADNSGSLKPVVDTLGGLAIGYATGGTAGAFTGANADWNNRQLHYSERQWIKQNAEEFAKKYNIVDENGEPDIPKATERLAQQAARQTDFLWALALPGEEDKAAAEFLATANETFTNGIGKEQKYFTTQGNDFAHSEKYADDVGSDYEDYYKKYLISDKNNNINERAKELVKQKTKDTVEYVKENPKEAAKKTGEFVWDTGKAIVGGMVDCGKQLGKCAGEIKDEFVETGKAIGQGGSALANDSLQDLYGQDTRTAQGLIFAGTLTEAALTATGVGKLGGSAVKTGGKVVATQAEKKAAKAAEEAAEKARKTKQEEINAGLDSEMVGQAETLMPTVLSIKDTGKVLSVNRDKGTISKVIDGKVVEVNADIADIPTSTKILGHYGTTVEGKLSAKEAATFRNSTYFETVTTEPTVLYRVYGGSAGQLGAYWTTTKPAGSVQSIVDTALNPQWGNTATKVVKIEVPAGVTLYQGKAAQQVGLVGGGTQVYFPKGSKVDPKWIMEN